MNELRKFIYSIVRFLAILSFILPFVVVGLFIGIFCYANKTDWIGLTLLFVFSVGSLVIGIVVLRWFLKGNRMSYIAGTNASRDIDDIIKKDKK